MSDSDGSEDPRHRIPRGASDEEIDSDEASGYESGGGDAQFGDDGLLAAPPPPRVPAAGINDAAARLRPRARGGDGGDDAGLEVPSSDEESGDGSETGGVGDEVLAAATGRKDFAERARRRREAARGRAAARAVVAGDGEEGVLRAARGDAGGARGGHAAMLERMVGVLEGQRGGMGELKKKLGRVSGAKASPLDAPLPAVVASRVGRAVAYGKTVEEVGKWAGTVRKNRGAKQLVFPLNEPGGARSRGTREIGERVAAGNEFEAEVDGLLKDAGMVTEEGARRAEEEALIEAAGRVSKEDLLKRRRELARMRSAVFENDRKLKRIKKIKSRKFRKVMKMEKERVAQEARAAGLGGGSDEEEEDAIRAERDRAEERMNLRHKNTSKWVKRQLQRGEVRRNENTREAVEEQLRIGEELRKKMDSSGLVERDEGSSGDSGRESDGDDEERGMESLAAIRDDLAAGTVEEGRKKRQKGLLGMKFMQDAQERRRKEALGLLGEMGDSEDDGDGLEDGEGENGGAGGADRVGLADAVGKGQDGAAVGRRVYTGKSLAVAKRTDGAGANGAVGNLDDARDGATEGLDTGENGELTAAEAQVLEQRVRSEYGSTPAGAVAVAQRKDLEDRLASNAVELAADGDAAGEVRGQGFTTTLEGRIEAPVPGVRRPSAPVATPATVSHAQEVVPAATAVVDNPWLQPVGAKRKRSKRHAAEAVEELVVALPAATGKSKRQRKKARGGQTEGSLPGKPETHGVPGESEEEGATNNDDESRMLIAARAFAGAGGADLADFEASKQAEIERSLPTAKDVGAVVLPGWGCWAGADGKASEDKSGADGKKGRKTEKKPVAETPFAKAAREKLEAARASALAARTDARLSHVIVSARRAKKAADLTMASVPFPYTSAAQWKQEVAAPLVRERLTGTSHTAAIKPKIVIPRGEAVQPLRLSLAQKEERRRADKSGAIKRRGNRAQQRDGKRRSLLG